MASLRSNSIPVDDESVAGSQSELSDLNSSTFDGINLEDIDDNASSTQASSQPAKKKRKRMITAVNTWSYARPAKEGEEVRNTKLKPSRKWWYCKICPYWRDTVTTNIRSHLHSKHSIVVKEKESKVKQLAKHSLEGAFLKQEEIHATKVELDKENILRSIVKPEVIREALVQLIIVRNLPYSAAAWPELHALCLACNYACKDILLGSRNAIPGLIDKSFILDKAVLRDKLQSALTGIHLSLDVWSSPNRKSFLAVVAHFVDAGGVLRKALLALPFLPGKHGGVEQLEVLWPVLQDYNILDKLGYCVGDNHGSNDLLLQKLSQRLNQAGIEAQFNAKQHRIRCHGHVLNIAAQAFFFSEDKEAVDVAFAEAKEKLEQGTELDEDQIEEILAKQFKKGKASKFTYRKLGPPGKVHTVVAHIRSSNARHNNFVHLAGRAIPMDNETRWNSWYFMILVALEPRVRQAIGKYQENYVNEFDDDDILNLTDWKALESIRDFLQPFQRVTKETEGDKGTLDQVLYTMDFMVEHFKVSKVCISL